MGHANLALVGESFALLDDVVALTDIAMSSRDARRIVPMLVDGLRGVIASSPSLPPSLLVADPAGYIRRELYRSPRFGYQVIAITWAPGQGSGVHDHAQTWGVEAVLRGQLEVVDYRIAGRHKALAELHPAGHRPLPAGEVIGLLPPHDLHSCRNASNRETAVSLHVYGTPLDSVKRYAHVEDALYRAERVRLSSA
jgi:3-mercaptopropionate dioxygenase